MFPAMSAVTLAPEQTAVISRQPLLTKSMSNIYGINNEFSKEILAIQVVRLS